MVESQALFQPLSGNAINPDGSYPQWETAYFIIAVSRNLWADRPLCPVSFTLFSAIISHRFRSSEGRR